LPNNFPLMTQLEASATTIMGVQVFNFEQRHAARGATPDAAGAMPMVWHVMMRDSAGMGMMDICSSLQGAAGCIDMSMRGSNNKGTGCFVLRATETELGQMIIDHSTEIDFVEADLSVAAIPSLSAGPAAPSLLQADQPVAGLSNLDRIDDRVGLDGSYDVPISGGAGVNVYITDTGVRTTHTQFGGRAIPTLEYVDGQIICDPTNTSCADDLNGHGTHVAGIAAGTIDGVAKSATIRAVKVLDEQGGGDLNNWIRALNWIITEGPRPAVVSASLGGEGVSAIASVVVMRAVEDGIVVIVASGNNNDDACRFSPASVPDAITVSATNDQDDQRAEFSNFGACVDIFAPGVEILSLSYENDEGTRVLSGTSQANPHVAGAAALLLQSGVQGQDVAAMMMQQATADVVGDAGPASPNTFLFVQSEMLVGAPVQEILIPGPTPAPGGAARHYDAFLSISIAALCWSFS
jgi:subtilisin family serine protease